MLSLAFSWSRSPKSCVRRSEVSSSSACERVRASVSSLSERSLLSASRRSASVVASPTIRSASVRASPTSSSALRVAISSSRTAALEASAAVLTSRVSCGAATGFSAGVPVVVAAAFAGFSSAAGALSADLAGGVPPWAVPSLPRSSSFSLVSRASSDSTSSRNWSTSPMSYPSRSRTGVKRLLLTSSGVNGMNSPFCL